jgi:hypothetical protein
MVAVHAPTRPRCVVKRRSRSVTQHPQANADDRCDVRYAEQYAGTDGLHRFALIGRQPANTRMRCGRIVVNSTPGKVDSQGHRSFLSATGRDPGCPSDQHARAGAPRQCAGRYAESQGGRGSMGEAGMRGKAGPCGGPPASRADLSRPLDRPRLGRPCLQVNHRWRLAVYEVRRLAHQEVPDMEKPEVFSALGGAVCPSCHSIGTPASRDPHRPRAHRHVSMPLLLEHLGCHRPLYRTDVVRAAVSRSRCTAQPPGGGAFFALKCPV